MRFLRRAFVAALLVAATACSSERPVKTLLLFTMESVRADDSSAAHYGWSTTDTTPPEYGGNFSPQLPEDLDDFARGGIRFAQAFAPSGSPFPSLVALHSGRPPEELGVYNEYSRLAGVSTLAELLSLRGVRCGAFVRRKALAPPCGLERGFGTYVACDKDDQLVLEAHVWLRSMRLAAPDRPIFLWIHLSNPSPPYQPIWEYRKVICPDAEPAAGSLDELELFAANPALRTLERRRAVHGLHAASVLQGSDAAQVFLETARPLLGSYESTTMIFAGTNGDQLGARGHFGGRGSLRDAALHVPLFYWGAGVAGRPKVGAPVVEMYDLTRTIATRFDCDPPEGSHGRDLLALLDDPSSKDHVAFASWENRAFAARALRERLICDPLRVAPGGWPGDATTTIPEELFDEQADPEESANLALSASASLERMRAHITRLRASVRPAPPADETDAARIEAIRRERIHGEPGHPATPIPAGTCGERP